MQFLKRYKLLLSVLTLAAAGLYFLSIPVLLWRCDRDLDLAKNHQETFFNVSTLEFTDGTAAYGIGFDSHYSILHPLSGTIVLLDGNGTKRRMTGGHICGGDGLGMYMRIYEKIQERDKLPATNPSFLEFLHRQKFKE
jgi:hypothetical protein